MSGDDDTVVPARASRLAAERLGADSLRLLAETGHLPMDERPAELAAVLLEFFAEREER